MRVAVEVGEFVCGVSFVGLEFKVDIAGNFILVELQLFGVATDGLASCLKFKA